MEMSDLLEKVDIVEYISQFVDLKQVGDEWWGLSCFKEENTPSFSVRQNPPVFFDYSSGIGGNAFSFAKKYFRCSSQEAVDRLKEFAGLDGDVSVRTERLEATKICRKFLQKRSARKDNIAKPLSDNYMERYERREDKLKAWVDEGISPISLDSFQVRYDSYTNRIVYPIRNLEGKIVNIGGRTLDPDWKNKGLRKYNYYFKWGALDIIYGLWENLPYIMKKKEIILFEGCKSVLLADSWQIKNTGAILTSHLNPDQMKVLARLGVKVVFALDKDVDVRADKNIEKLKQYVNVSYLYDKDGFLDEKDSPVDKGKEVFKKLYNENQRKL